MSAGTLRTSAATLPSRILSRSARVLFSATLAIALAVPAPALAWRAGSDRIGGTPLSESGLPADRAPDIEAAAGILTTSDGRAVWSRKGTTPRAMASTTKMMTALLVLENTRPQEKVKISARASRVAYGVGLRAGERLSVRRLLQLTLVASSNDAAYALGEHVAGNMPAFVRMMNAKAKKLGLEDTRFANPHGLDASNHYSSPEDLASLAHVVMKNAEFRRTVALRKVYLPAAKGRAARTLKATDELLGKYPGLNGVKTGYTRRAGFSFVASATRGDVTLTAVILGAKSNPARFRQAARLLDWGFRNVQKRKVSWATKTFAEVPSSHAPSSTVPVRYASSQSRLVFKLDGTIRPVASLPARVSRPVFKGQPLGKVTVMQGERVLARMYGVAATSTISAEQTVGAVPLSNFVDRTVAVRASNAPLATVPRFDATKPVRTSIRLQPSVSAPVAEGDLLGEITYWQGKRIVVRVPVVAAESVEAPSLVQNIGTAFARSWLALVGGRRIAAPEVADA